MRRSCRLILAALALSGLLTGCARKGVSPAARAASGRIGALVSGPSTGGAVSVVTKNTTRLGGPDAVSDAAAVAQAVYPGLTAATRPQVVVLVSARSWPASLAASVLAAAPLRAPLLYADGASLPPESERALRTMRPTGAAALGGAQVVAIGTAAVVPLEYRSRGVSLPSRLRTDRAPVTAAAIERLYEAIHGGAPRTVIVVADDIPRALQMPVAGLAAESADPILLISSGAVPPATASVLASLHGPTIYLVGAAIVSSRARAQLARLGRLVEMPRGSRTGTPLGASAGATRAAGSTGATGASAQVGATGSTGRAGAGPRAEAVENAIAISRFGSGSFGWNIHEAGHGLVFANASRPFDGPAAAPLSAHGDYGPLLLLGRGDLMPDVLARYLADIEPGYSNAVPPVRAVYNHGWLIGDEGAISVRVQAEIDAALEVVPRGSSVGEAPSAPAE